MEEAFHGFFVNLIGKPVPRSHTLDLDYLNVPSHDLSSLEAHFTEDEVWEAIKSLPSEKALGPDGFIALFYQKCWGIIKDDVMAAIYKLGNLAGNYFHLLNQAMITLVPKKLAAQEARDFHPISLLHSFAKLFSKILARRLAPELAKVVAPNQTSFIKSRSIHDNFFLVRQSARLLH